jgi:peptidoglycan hydrolase-like protein with peptidoglycan-binding domain
MHTFVAVLMCSLLWLCPILVEAGTTGERQEQPQVITKDNVKLLQERLAGEGVYAGPLDGELSAQTEAALRAYQQQHGLPVSGAADEATLKQLQLELPTIRQGEQN